MTLPPSLQPIVSPVSVYSRAEVLARPWPVPAAAGVYGWFFRELPSAVMNVQDCQQFQGLHLLYVGISPHRRSPDLAPSRNNMRMRIRTHYAGNADASTLRMTLGCLLADQLGIRLRRTPAGRFRFFEGELALSAWMAENAFVAWHATPSPWELEELALRHLDLPLNLRDNETHIFHPALSAARRAARLQSRLGP